MNTMHALRDFAKNDAARITTVFTDIDDTLTTEGRLPQESFAALWSLHDAGYHVVPVTGRPAGWCDHFARMWPVAGIVGENGAFYFRYDDTTRRMTSRFVLDDLARKDLQTRLAKVRDQILHEVPGCAVASDQPYRIHDLAIDFCEDVARLPEAAVQKIVEIFHAAGATAKVSSIHVNGWFGSYDKLGMIRQFAREVLTLDLDGTDLSRAIYAGDSPNDEPAFAFFTQSVGVANVKQFVARMKHLPTFVTEHEGGAGFAELARHLIQSRA